MAVTEKTVRVLEHILRSPLRVEILQTLVNDLRDPRRTDSVDEIMVKAIIEWEK